MMKVMFPETKYNIGDVIALDCTNDADFHEVLGSPKVLLVTDILLRSDTFDAEYYLLYNGITEQEWSVGLVDLITNLYTQDDQVFSKVIDHYNGI